MSSLREATAIMQLRPDQLSTAFFSDKNVDEIQKQLADVVFDRTGKRIGRQSDVELLGIMQGVYDAFSRHTGGKKEIRRLNAIVLDIVIDQVISGIDAYLTYIKDASTMPEPLDRGIFASIKGKNSLEYKVGFS